MVIRRLGRLVLAGTLALAACQGPGADTTTSSSDGTSAPPTTASTTTTTLPADEDAGLDTPRSVNYAHVVLTLTGGEYSNATPATYLDGQPNLGGTRYLYLSFFAQYEPDYPGRDERFEATDFTLNLADGTSVTAEAVAHFSPIRFPDRARVEWALAFPASELDPVNAVLTFYNRVNEPVQFPLDGPTPVDPYPILIPVGANGEVEYRGGCAPAAGTVNVLDAEWDVDGGVDQKGDRIVHAGTARSVVGERFVRVRVQAIAVSGNCGGTLVDDSHFRLVADGLPKGPENLLVTGLADGEGAELIWGFRIPVGVSELVFEVGLSDGVTASFPIEIPAELP